MYAQQFEVLVFAIPTIIFAIVCIFIALSE